MYFYPLFALLKDGRQMVVYSDNDDEGTVTVFPAAELPFYDAEFTLMETVKSTEVVRMERDRDTAFSPTVVTPA